MVKLYGPNKPFQRENFFQQLNNYVDSTQNTIIGGDFNKVTDLKDRIGSTICNTHLVGSNSLNKILDTQKLYCTWWKINPQKSEFTYHGLKFNIHSRLDRIYASHNLHIIQSYILTFPVLRPWSLDYRTYSEIKNSRSRVLETKYLHSRTQKF